MTTQHDKAKRWRPWQFRLRTLMLIMFGVACFLGGWQASEWKRQRELERAKQDGPMMKAMKPDVQYSSSGFQRR